MIEQSHLPAKQTQDRLGIPRSTFYLWYDKYQTGGVDGEPNKNIPSSIGAGVKPGSSPGTNTPAATGSPAPNGDEDPEDDGDDFENPNDIRFGQDSINRNFSDGRSVQSTIDGLKSGRIRPGDLPAIRVTIRNGQRVTLDNRRLFAAREAGVSVRTRSATAAEVRGAEAQGKFSAGPSGGNTIRVR